MSNPRYETFLRLPNWLQFLSYQLSEVLPYLAPVVIDEHPFEDLKVDDMIALPCSFGAWNFANAVAWTSKENDTNILDRMHRELLETFQSVEQDGGVFVFEYEHTGKVVVVAAPDFAYPDIDYKGSVPQYHVISWPDVRCVADVLEDPDVVHGEMVEDRFSRYLESGKFAEMAST